MNYQNIEIQNKREQSKYPFTGDSTLEIGKYIFPVNWIKSLSVQVSSAVFPLYINTLYVQGDFVVLKVLDKNAQIQCYLKIGATQSKIETENGIICGQLYIDTQLYSWLYNLIKSTVSGYIDLNSNALIFDGSVITCVHFKGYTGLSINNKYIGSDVLLNFERNIQVEIDGASVVLNVYGDYDYSFQKISKLQSVNNIDLKNKSLIIQHRALSNLRIATETNKISLIGVTDVT